MDSLVQELTQWAEAFFRRPDDPDLPPAPKQLGPFVDLFLELSEWRGYDRQMQLPEVLSIETVAAWTSVTGVKLSRFELNLIQKLEGAWWDAIANPYVPNRASLFSQMKEMAISEGKVRTVSVNPRKKQ